MSEIDPVTMEVAEQVVEATDSQIFFGVDPRQILQRSTGDKTMIFTHLGIFVVGVVFGLVVLGWYVFPVQWIPPETLSTMPQPMKTVVINNMAEKLSLDGNAAQSKRDIEFLFITPSHEICEAFQSELDVNKQFRLRYLYAAIYGGDIECS